MKSVGNKMNFIASYKAIGNPLETKKVNNVKLWSLRDKGPCTIDK